MPPLTPPPLDPLEKLVTRHQDAPSPRLTHDWALLRLLDQRHCQALQSDLQVEASPWEVHDDVNEHLWEVLPDQPGLYLFVWRPPFRFVVEGDRRPGDVSQVLYVGQTGSGNGKAQTLRDRFKAYRRHLSSDPSSLWEGTTATTRTSLLDRYLTLRPLEFWFTVVPDRSHIGPLEDRLIKLLTPPCNSQLLPKLVALPARPAF